MCLLWFGLVWWFSTLTVLGDVTWCVFANYVQDCFTGTATICVIVTIDQFHKSCNAPALYPTMHHSEQKFTHFFSEWCMGYRTGALWDLRLFNTLTTTNTTPQSAQNKLCTTGTVRHCIIVLFIKKRNACHGDSLQWWSQWQAGDNRFTLPGR